jgi:isopenicillin N synthase-like dioxygenase
MARIAIPANMLAFQLGEVTQIISGGYLEATPHCVVRNNEIAGKKISRDTFALFMEPNGLHELSVPEGINESEITMKAAYKIPELKKRWKNGMLFKDFHHTTIKHYS